MLFFLLAGCAAYEELFGLLEDPPTPPCETRGAWWQDADGDGVGGTAEVWVSCETPPDGWVEATGDCDDADPAVTTGCDTGSDTAPADTADTAESG